MQRRGEQMGPWAGEGGSKGASKGAQPKKQKHTHLASPPYRLLEPNKPSSNSSISLARTRAIPNRNTSSSSSSDCPYLATYSSRRGLLGVIDSIATGLRK